MRHRRLGSDTITIRVPTLVSDTRDNTGYYEYEDGSVIRGCSFQPFLMTEKFQEEFTSERDATRTFYRVFVPWNTETEQITDKHRILFEGIEYEVHALRGQWRKLNGEKHHIAFLVKKRAG